VLAGDELLLSGQHWLYLPDGELCSTEHHGQKQVVSSSTWHDEADFKQRVLSLLDGTHQHVGNKKLPSSDR
jgi:hypothetical protein